MATKTTKRPPPQYPDLAAYFAETGDTQAHMAEVLQMPQSHVSRIAAGLLVPRPLLAARIAAYARIPMESFQQVYLARRRKAS